ncbi:hydroxyacid dehydrogenase [Candidatus Kaiserbacteria bacterium]|nr:hydroxyacid dehydrogenase [Candidatus Kaiserbacteria bacterium]
MKIHYFAGEEWEEKLAREKLADHDIVFHNGPLSDFPDLADPEAEALCVFIEAKIGEAEMARFPALKLIATRSTGFDHIDLAAAKPRGIAIANVPYYGENTVAEFTFALLLALSRRIIDADERVRAGAFSTTGLRGFDLAGKTLGVIGTGHIGAHVIRMAQGFSTKVLGYDAFPNAELAQKLGFSYVSLPELLAASDIVTIHVPYNEHTHHLLNRENIGTLKKGSFLINTARGAVIETAALIEALKSESLAGAALDVLEEEGDMADEAALLTAPHPRAEELAIALANHYLIEHPRVIVTPHVAFNTTEAVERILNTSIDNIRQFAAGSPANLVPQS